MGGSFGRNRGGQAFTITTPPTIIEQPWVETDWTEFYVPTTVQARREPVIYVAVPFPPGGGGCGGGFGGGFGGGMGGLGGGFGGLGGFPGGGLGGFGF